MKTNITEEDLIALHMQELEPAREREVRLAIAVDAALAAEYGAVAATFAGLQGKSVKVDAAVVDRNWKVLRPSLKTHVLPAPVPAWRMPVLAGLALAGAATVAYVALHVPGGAPAAEKTVPPAPSQGTTGPTFSSPASSGPSAMRQPGEVTPPMPMPSDSGFRVRLGGGVYHQPEQRSESPIRMLSLATTHSWAGATPDAARREQRPAAAPLTEQPTPAVALTAEPVVPQLAGPEAAGKNDSAARGGLAGVVKGVAVRSNPRRTSDVMLGLGGTFIVPRTSQNALTLPEKVTATHAIVALAAVHQQFRTALGYRVTASYTRPDFEYSYARGSGQMNSRIFELAATYVVQGPHHKGLSTSFDIGGGGLLFVPQVQSSSGQKLTRAEGVLGVNVDYAITSRLGARLGYRAKVFRVPEFQDLGIFVNTPLTGSNEPELGVTYRFGK